MIDNIVLPNINDGEDEEEEVESHHHENCLLSTSLTDLVPVDLVLITCLPSLSAGGWSERFVVWQNPLRFQNIDLANQPD